MVVLIDLALVAVAVLLSAAVVVALSLAVPARLAPAWLRRVRAWADAVDARAWRNQAWATFQPEVVVAFWVAYFVVATTVGPAWGVLASVVAGVTTRLVGARVRHRRRAP